MGLIALVLAVVRGGVPGLARTALGLFVLAALGGFVLLSQHLRDRPLSTGLAVAHGLLAAVSFILLLLPVAR